MTLTIEANEAFAAQALAVAGHGLDGEERERRRIASAIHRCFRPESTPAVRDGSPRRQKAIATLHRRWHGHRHVRNPRLIRGRC